jgi:predicted AAA+ superfamily ATPase
MYVHRALEKFIPMAGRQFPVVLMIGARQVGKTTLLAHLRGEDRTYVSLDDPLLLQLAREDPALFLQKHPPPLLVDEIQYAPQLLPHIKMAVDRNPCMGAFWLTGSQLFHLMKGVSESLAGRVAVVRLLGLSRRELVGDGLLASPFLPNPERGFAPALPAQALDLLDAYRLIWRGSYPGLALFPDKDRDLFYGSYLATYLQRDVRDLARVGDESSFLRFVRACAARTAQLLNLSELARDSGVAVNTAKAWLSILESSGIVHLLAPYHTNATKRLVKAPKLHFLDTGLCAYLAGWSSPETLEAGAAAGPLLETWAVSEILRSYLHNGRPPEMYFFRDRDKVEIDILLVRDGIVYPLEVKKTAAPVRADVRHFQALERLGLRVGPGGVLSFVARPTPLTSSAWAIPFSAL